MVEPQEEWESGEPAPEEAAGKRRQSHDEEQGGAGDGEGYDEYDDEYDEYVGDSDEPTQEELALLAGW